MEEEKRKKTRVAFEARVVVRAGDETISSEANSRDISLRGILVHSDRALAPGTACDLEILLTGSTSRLSINATGQVTRETADGFAVTFDPLDVDSYYHLKNLLLYNAQDPDALEQEILPIP